jgi:ketol-acid reductoisomerase
MLLIFMIGSPSVLAFQGKTLYFSHGFSVTYAKDTGVVPPKDIDVVLVAPKGSGTTLRSLFLEVGSRHSLCSTITIFSPAPCCCRAAV